MEKDIGKIQKNDTSDIMVRIDDFGGNRGLTVREFITSDRYTGFTKAGVRILAKDFPKFKEMINSISEDEMKAEPEESATPKDAPSNTEDAPVEKPAETPKENLPDY
ncbi:MAG: hypothetical protein U9Q99_00070 [Nanoarchaeota archaeon]|nr:hypothetical protein [Nanoarchaeota archaeon]